MVKTAALGIRITPTVKEALEAAAKADRRSVAAYVEKLIVDDLISKGLVSPDAV